MKFKIGILLSFLAIISCEKQSQSVEKASESFSQEEMRILSENLNLNATLYNYANLNLPDHFFKDEVFEMDNTPEYNVVTNAGATLGRVLFYDKKLSANGTISCASCHKQSAAFSDNAKFSKGLNGGLTKRNSMTLVNSRYYGNGRFMWDESAETLEEQVLMPIQDHIEMNMDLDALVIKLKKEQYYEVLFNKAFGSSDVSSDKIALALSQFIRSIVSFNTKFDQGLILAGTPDVDEQITDLPNFTTKEKDGMDIFLRGRNGATCGYCHGTAQLVNDEAKNNGLALVYQDKGKGAVTGNPTHNALFKVPTLKNIELTAPYMHDGRFQTLEEVIEHYNNNVQPHPNLNFRLTTLDDPNGQGGDVLKLNLSSYEKDALLAFLKTLTDHELLKDPKYSNPFK